MDDGKAGRDEDAPEAANTAEGSHKFTPRMWLYIAVAIAVVAIVVAAALLRRGDSSDHSASGESTLTAEATAAGGVDEGANGPFDGSGELDSADVEDAGAASESGGTHPPGAGPAEQELAPEGSELETLTAPPPKTLGLLTLPEGFTSATFRYTFSPYGWGPGGEQGGRLIIKIVKAEPKDGDASEFKDYTGYNASLWVLPELVEKVKVGGTYSGTVVVREQGDVGVLWLTKLED
ncbi:MAG: hypothetical protein OEV43_06340 [Coriobacteriia bacterium]|nr:hypothetical protein [Coriobacteriia bacterium]